jgi:hypothetical protein
MGSSGMIYLTSLINIGSGIQKLLGEYTHSLLLFFQKKKSRIKMGVKKKTYDGAALETVASAVI